MVVNIFFFYDFENVKSLLCRKGNGSLMKFKLAIQISFGLSSVGVTVRAAESVCERSRYVCEHYYFFRGVNMRTYTDIQGHYMSMHIYTCADICMSL